MTFSSFTIPLQLVRIAQPWDGDVIADDHHNYLKCFLYCIYHHLVEQEEEGQFSGINPELVLRPILLPVKSTSVEAETCRASWKARFNQAKRHTQGVAELAYIFMGAWRCWLTVPCRSTSLCLRFKLLRVVLLPLCINMLPMCQPIPFAIMTILSVLEKGVPWWKLPKTYWLTNCDGLDYKLSEPTFYYCWLAGRFNLLWPLVICYGLMILAGYCVVAFTFLEPAPVEHENDESDEDSEAEDSIHGIWETADGNIPACCGSKHLTVLLIAIVDILLLFPIVMFIYGLIPAIMSYWNCMIRGNLFDFKSAAKGKANEPPGIGDSESDDDSSTDEDEPQGVLAGKSHHYSQRPSRKHFKE